MSYINQIVEDGVTYDIAAKNLVNGFTQTTPGVNALDAAAGKSLNDSLEKKFQGKGIRTYREGAFQITNSKGEIDFANDFSSVDFCLAVVANTASGQVITACAVLGTVVSVTCVPRSNMTSTTNTTTPVVRFFVYGTLK